MILDILLGTTGVALGVLPVLNCIMKKYRDCRDGTVGVFRARVTAKIFRLEKTLSDAGISLIFEPENIRDEIEGLRIFLRNLQSPVDLPNFFGIKYGSQTAENAMGLINKMEEMLGEILNRFVPVLHQGKHESTCKSEMLVCKQSQIISWS